MSQFFSPDSINQQKEVNLSEKFVPCPLEKIEQVYDIEKCVLWALNGKYKKICLQFPDHLLCDSAQISRILQEKLKQNVYILADTAYESCCIDYVAAEHINADAIIHFGPICFSQTSAKIPYLNIYEKKLLDITDFCRIFREKLSENVVIVLDTPYIHLENEIRDKTNAKILKIDENIDYTELENSEVIFICEKNRKLLNFALSNKYKRLYYYNATDNFVNFEQDTKLLKRRYFLIEKIKDSKTIGIIIGTLGVKNYLEQIQRIKKLIDLSNKKYYLISVGKPSVAKLANFPEIDIYVIVTCALNDIYDNRDYYKPIVTPYDIEIALNPQSKNIPFSFDYNSYISNELDEDKIRNYHQQNNDISLITGQVRSNQNFDTETSKNTVTDLEKTKTDLIERSSGALYLSERTWKGLEQDLGQTPPELATEGRRGIAQGYQDENLT